MKNKFRASFTILDLWQSGNWEMAVKAYFKLDKFTSPEMEDGIRWHNLWQKHIQTTKTMPIEFGSKALQNPVCEKKQVVQLADWLELVGIIDCYDSPVVYDWKTGKTSSEVYAGSMQGGIYGVLATMLGYYVEQVQIHHYDQYMKKSDMSAIWITPKLLEETHNKIITISSDMYTYFNDNGLFDRFGAQIDTGTISETILL